MVGVSGGGDMMRAVFDSDLDGKIAKAATNQVLHTLSVATVLYSQGYVDEQSSSSQTYAERANRSFVAIKGGDYLIKVNMKTGNGSYEAMGGYRINGGSWVEIGTTLSTTYEYVAMGSAVHLSDGDTVEIGLRRNTSTAIYVYMDNFRVEISKIDRLE